MRSLIGLRNNQPALVKSNRSFGSKPTRPRRGNPVPGLGPLLLRQTRRQGLAGEADKECD